MTPIVPNLDVPPGRYIVQYFGDHESGECIAVDFDVSVGEYRGRRIQMLICTRKAMQAIRQRSGLWLEWMAYEGDSRASKVIDSIHNAVAGHFFADVEDGCVKKTFSPTRDETTFNKFLDQLSELWVLRQGIGSQHQNLESCQYYTRMFDLLPRIWGATPGERELRRWLNEVTDPLSPSYFHEASVWLNSVYTRLGGAYEISGVQRWPLILKNNGFDCPPKRPKGMT